MMEEIVLKLYPDHVWRVVGKGTRESPFRFRCDYCGRERGLMESMTYQCARGESNGTI